MKQHIAVPFGRYVVTSNTWFELSRSGDAVIITFNDTSANRTTSVRVNPDGETDCAGARPLLDETIAQCQTNWSARKQRSLASPADDIDLPIKMRNAVLLDAGPGFADQIGGQPVSVISF